MQIDVLTPLFWKCCLCTILICLSQFCILPSRYLLNLQYLSLAYSRKFTDKGLQYLSSGKGCHKVIYLDLSGCTQVSPLPFFFHADRKGILGGRSCVLLSLCIQLVLDLQEIWAVLNYKSAAAYTLLRHSTIGTGYIPRQCHAYKQLRLTG